MEKVADFMNRRGYSVTVGNSDDQGFGVSSGPMMLFLGAGNDVIAGLDFHCSISDKTIISRYYGRGKDFGKTGSIFLASLDYERDIVPTLANFIPFALGMGEIVWRSTGRCPRKIGMKKSATVRSQRSTALRINR